ncbi:hypothetical protein OROHE_013714 [Orobanche hederae]
MAAYAALLSVKHIMIQIQQHPRPPISLHQKQAHSLTENLNFLQDFLERYSKEEEEDGDELESRIADAAYAAEGVIESHVVDQIHGEYLMSSTDLYQSLERVIQDMDSIKKELVEKMGGTRDLHQPTNSWVSIDRVRPVSSRMQKNTMVVVDCGEILNGVLDKLTRHELNLEIIPMVGTGGIGKTMIARNVYAKPLVVEHFYIHAWVTMSKECSRREFLQVLCREIQGSINNDLSEMSEDELGHRVYQHLWGRRYLIVIDDIWSIEIWDKVKTFFPNNNMGSRIMITTRSMNLASKLSVSLIFELSLLNEVESWELLGNIVFGKEDCPSELKSIGKKIARNCRGLPLSIVVIGGLLKKSSMTPEYWEYTLENLNSVIDVENTEYCLQILYMSYKELPVHLKPCFLYMGVFPEDDQISSSHLIKLWVAEGFLKPIDDKSLEEVAEEYFDELVNRNLIAIHKWRWNVTAKSCTIHDLLRDVCLREARKQRFLCVLRSQDLDIPRDVNMERRVCIRENAEEKSSSQIEPESMSLTRSLHLSKDTYEPSPGFKLLRVYSRTRLDSRKYSASLKAIFQQANLRYISIRFLLPRSSRFPSCSLLWNLQTILVKNFMFSLFPLTAPFHIWKMPLLRHVFVNELELVPADPPCGEDDVVLKNLQTLSCIWNFKCSEEVVKRIPNVKILKLVYSTGMLPLDEEGFPDFCLDNIEEEGLPDFCLDNLGRLQKLESLNLFLRYPISELLRTNLVDNLTFPGSLKKLTLRGTNLSWEDMTRKIGSLPLLEVLKLKQSSCLGRKWKTVEGLFCSLRILVISSCSDLEKWKMDDETHFPCLVHLGLEYLDNLKEIPSGVGDVATLQSIQLNSCSKSVEDSAKSIKEEMEDCGNEDFQLHIGKE